jgi:hypothetical protein
MFPKVFPSTNYIKSNSIKSNLIKQDQQETTRASSQYQVSIESPSSIESAATVVARDESSRGLNQNLSARRSSITKQPFYSYNKNVFVATRWV